MRKFITTSIYQHGEQQATEQGTNKTFTLTQRKKITESDYYDITRFIAVDNEYNNTPEPDNYVYQFNYMVTGCSLTSVIVDEQTAKQFISDNLLSFMQSKINSILFQKYFENPLTT